MRVRFFNRITFAPEAGGGTGTEGENEGGSVDLSNPDIKAAIDAAVEAATSGLKTNRDSLKAEKLRLQKELDRFSGIDPDEVAKLIEDSKEKEEQDAKDKGEWDKILEARDSKHAKALDEVTSKLTARAERSERALQERIVNSELQAALIDVDVAKHFMGAVGSLLRNKIKVVEDDDAVFRAYVEVDGDEVPVSQFVKHWSDTDEGKHFVVAPENGGGGQNGEKSGNGGRKVANPFKRESLNLTEQGKILKSDPNKARRLMQEAGKDPSVYGL